VIAEIEEIANPNDCPQHNSNRQQPIEEAGTSVFLSPARLPAPASSAGLGLPVGVVGRGRRGRERRRGGGGGGGGHPGGPQPPTGWAGGGPRGGGGGGGGRPALLPTAPLGLALGLPERGSSVPGFS
jgi:hypothetical protein